MGYESMSPPPPVVFNYTEMTSNALYMSSLFFVGAVIQVVDADLNATMARDEKARAAALSPSCPPQPNKILHHLKKSLPSALIRAAYAGDLPKLKTLVTHENIFMRDSWNNTLAHLAAQVGNIDILRFLFSKERSLIEAKGLYGGSPLYAATVHMQDHVVKFLLEENGADADARINTWGQYGVQKGRARRNFSTLHHAARHGHLYIVKMLLRHGANSSARDGYGHTPLHSAAFTGQLEVVKCLIEWNDDSGTSEVHGIGLAHVRSNSNDLPIHLAAGAKRANIVRYLTQLDPSQLASRGLSNMTVLHFVAMNNDTATLRDILKYQPDLEAVGNYANDTNGTWPSVTALMFAAARGHRHIVQMLLDAGANGTAVDWRGNSAIHLAAMGRYDLVVERLLDKNPESVNLAGEKSYTPLHLAIENRQFELVRLLLQRGANTSANAAYWDDPKIGIPRPRRDLLAYDPLTTTPSATPLHFAARVGNIQIFRALVESGAPIDQPDSQSGRFPIHLAALNGHIAILEELLALDKCQLEWRGGNLGDTPLSTAIRGNRTLAVKYLLQMGANVEAKARHAEDQADGELTASSLHLAIQQANYGMVEMLLLSDGDPNAADITGRTPLHESLVRSNDISHPITTSLIDLLIRHGAVSGVEDVKGQTAADYASEDDPDGINFRLLIQSELQPLHRAVLKESSVFIRKAVVHLTTRLHQRNGRGETALEMAVRLGNEEIAGAMMKAGLRVDTLNADGNTLLHIAASHVNPTIRAQFVEMIAADTSICIETLSILAIHSNHTGVSVIDIAKHDPIVAEHLPETIRQNLIVQRHPHFIR